MLYINIFCRLIKFFMSLGGGNLANLGHYCILFVNSCFFEFSVSHRVWTTFFGALRYFLVTGVTCILLCKTHALRYLSPAVPQTLYKSASLMPVEHFQHLLYKKLHCLHQII